MGESDGSWGQLAADDPERAAVWDECAPIPDPGENPALDAFVESKGITHASLVRIGARLSDYSVLAFAGPGYLKFRDVVTDKRWSYVDCDWSTIKIVPAWKEADDGA